MVFFIVIPSGSRYDDIGCRPDTHNPCINAISIDDLESGCLAMAEISLRLGAVLLILCLSLSIKIHKNRGFHKKGGFYEQRDSTQICFIKNVGY